MKQPVKFLWLTVILIMPFISFSQDWKMKQARLMTSFSAKIDTSNVFPEYPRPQMVRANWMNLNGIWQFQPGAAGDLFPTGSLSGKILVPFPVESAISGVMKHYDRLWYKRTFVLPAKWSGKKVLLHFGAVDYESEVFVNGQSVGTHTGGYDPFTFDITSKLIGSGPQQLVVRVYDPTDLGGQPRGKQTLHPGGIMYTPVTGIWQPVWLEPVAQTAISELRMVANIDNATLKLSVTTDGNATGLTIVAKVKDKTNIIKTASGDAISALTISIPKQKLWTPDSPFLYDMQVKLLKNGSVIDSVNTYFGMRKISIGKVDGFQKMLLNNKFVFEIGPLDQGFWPDGIYTAPTDSALRYDLVKMKELGFNMVRKHIKVEPYRWYYWADKLGLMVWQDMPSANSYTDVHPPVDETAYKSELERMVKTHWNSPSIIMWDMFNESQGQHNTVGLVNDIKSLDPSRLVNQASGGNYEGVGDLLDIHSYPAPACPTSSTQALACGEYGGIAYGITNHNWGNGFGYVTVSNATDYTNMYDGFATDLAYYKTSKGLSAAVYTQITDVEVEINGLMTYDRAVVKADIAKLYASNVKTINNKIFLTELLPTSIVSGRTWKYTTTNSASKWYDTSFNDADWTSGMGGFGTTGTPGAIVRTNWNTPDIWMRQKFTMGQLSQHVLDNIIFRVHHDENCEIYINGSLAVSLAGYTSGYVIVPLTQSAKNLLKANVENVIAVHCHQTGGGQYIDVGISLYGSEMQQTKVGTKQRK